MPLSESTSDGIIQVSILAKTASISVVIPKHELVFLFTIRNMIRQQRAAPNHIVDYYYKLKKQPIPKKDKVATVACMNKLLKCMHAMVRAHTEYDYAYAVSVDH